MRTHFWEGVRYFISGMSAVIADWGCYYFLLLFFVPFWAKGISYLVGTCLSYFMNKFWTFKISHLCHKEAIRFLILYAVSLGINVLVNEMILSVHALWIFGAFIISTGTTTIFNYLGQKFWVFRRTRHN